jgi:DNA replication protein DnaC
MKQEQEQIKTIIPMMLRTLHLSTMLKQWEEYAHEADTKGWGCAKYLARLVENEIAERDTRRIARHQQESLLPKGKTFATFDFNRTPMVNKTQALNLGAGLSWIKDGSNVLIFGSFGAGKTHLAAAIGTALIDNGFRVLFKRTSELVQELLSAKRDLRLPDALDKLDKYHCLVLDDFGYVKKDNIETSVLFELISERYEKRSILLTCNQPFTEWDQIFQDKAMTMASIDRLIHHSVIFDLKEVLSYRKEDAMKKKSLKKA